MSQLIVLNLDEDIVRKLKNGQQPTADLQKKNIDKFSKQRFVEAVSLNT